MATFITSKTFADGDYLTYTELNAAIGDNGGLHWLKNALASIGITAATGAQTVDSAFVGARLSGSAQEIQDSAWTPIAWQTQRFGRWNGRDIDFLESSYPTFLNLPTRPLNAFNGYFVIGAHIAWAGNTTGSRGMRIVSRPVKYDLTQTYVLAEKMKEATGAGAVMNMSISTFDRFVQVGGSTGGNYTVEVYQDSGDTLGITQIANSSPEIWFTRVAAGPVF